MIILLLVLSILVTVISFIIAIKNDFESIGIFFSGLFVGVIGCLVLPDGYISDCYCYCNVGVRPVCILKSNIFVSKGKK